MKDKAERPERLSLHEKRDMQYEKFRTNLRVLRAMRNESCQEVGHALNFKRPIRIIELEYGKGNPKLEELLAISEYFSVSMDDLMNKSVSLTFE